jgi:hypothetical protein
MSFGDWLRVFRALHDKAKQGTLAGEDAEAYRAGCDELARALMAAQRLAAAPYEAPRHALRIARALQVELEGPGGLVRATTLEVGVGGFSAILAKAPQPGEELKASLRVPDLRAPLVAQVVPSDARPQAGATRVTFAFKKLSDGDRSVLETLVIDTALSQLAG